MANIEKKTKKKKKKLDASVLSLTQLESRQAPIAD